MLPQDKQGFSRLLRALRGLLSDDVTPQELTAAVLLQWHKQAFYTLPLPGVRAAIKVKQHPAVRDFSRWLAEHDLLDGAFWLSSAYSALLSSEDRKRQAMYFTPPYLSARALDNVGKLLGNSKIIDPACGGAAFLVPAACRIAHDKALAGYTSKQIIRHIEQHLYGSDTDAFLCVLACAFVRMALASHIVASGVEPRLRISAADGLRAFENELGTFDLVLSNPPYRKMKAGECEFYRPEYSDVMYGQPNLYSLFIFRATRLLHKSGHAVLVTPMSFLSGQSFGKVRATLSSEGTVAQFDLIHDKDGVFLGAEQDAVVTVWAKGARKQKTRVYELSASGRMEFVARYRMSSGLGPWPVPRRANDSELLKIFEGRHSILRDYGYVARTGAIVIHRNTRPTYASLVSGKQASCLVPLVWSRDIQDGRLDITEVTKVTERYVDVGSIDSLGVITTPSVVYQRVTSTDQPRRLVSAPVPKSLFDDFGGIAGENHVGILERTSNRPAVSPLLLSKVLSTETVDRLFRCISGATNVSAYEIERLPLPDIVRLRAALQRGLRLEDAVRFAYGLPARAREEKKTVEATEARDHEHISRARAAA